MSKITYNVSEKGWHNLLPAYIGYGPDNEIVVFPRYFATIMGWWNKLWQLLFTSDILIITGSISPVLITINEEGKTCGLDL